MVKPKEPKYVHSTDLKKGQKIIYKDWFYKVEEVRVKESSVVAILASQGKTSIVRFGFVWIPLAE